ncbi:MAG: hypothetical protein ABSA13_14205 [Beijerinckiaceae bacterium]
MNTQIELGGITKSVTTIEDLNHRFALLMVDGFASFYVTLPNFFPIKDSDLKRLLAPEVVATCKKDFLPRYIPAFKAWTENAGRLHIHKSKEEWDQIALHRVKMAALRAESMRWVAVAKFDADRAKALEAAQ